MPKSRNITPQRLDELRWVRTQSAMIDEQRKRIDAQIESLNNGMRAVECFINELGQIRDECTSPTTRVVYDRMLDHFRGLITGTRDKQAKLKAPFSVRRPPHNPFHEDLMRTPYVVFEEGPEPASEGTSIGRMSASSPTPMSLPKNSFEDKIREMAQGEGPNHVNCGCAPLNTADLFGKPMALSLLRVKTKNSRKVKTKRKTNVRARSRSRHSKK